ncbi:MAG TPA: hypothetical protein VH817_09845 [Thermoleophilaceae bacterium]
MRPLAPAEIRAALTAAVVLAALALALPGAASARVHGLKLGFTDSASFQFADPADRAIAFQHAKAAGASIIRVSIDWDKLAPNKPPNIATTANPAWSGYSWDFVDAGVREAVANGFTPLVIVTEAPTWAEGPNRPSLSQAPLGSWRPSPNAFQALATALAKRYSGHTPDPLQPGRNLPRVRYWQGWNEPNLTLYLSPQWTRSKGKLKLTSPDLYRAMLNAWYKGIKSVSSSNLVITAGTSPFGNPPGGVRVPPAQFVRALFCLSGRHALKKVRCPDSPVHFDILAHHPYPIGPPRRHAPNPDDVVVPDWDRLKRPLQVALKDRTVAPHKAKPLWATEISWDSSPPDPTGVPARLEATYMEGAFSTMWSQGVSAVVWYLMRDEAPDPSYDTTLQSGIYLRGPTIAQDTPKPSFTAFSFPFTAYIHKGKAQLWGLAPTPGSVTIERQAANGTWSTLTRLSARSDRLFLGSRRLRPGTNLRAVQGAKISLTWKVFSPGK